MKHAVIVGLALMVLTSAPGAKATPPPPGTSEEFSAYTYKERSGEFTVLVYSWPASWRAKDNFFPLVIAVGRSPEPHFKGETAAQKQEAKAKEKNTVVITLSNFQLTDAQGNSYVPASFEQITEQYKYLLADKSMVANEPMMTAQLFDSSGQLDAPFYPVSGGARLGINAVELENSTYFESIIYFPRPAAGLDGVLTFSLKGSPIESPINVRFMLPQPHQKQDKAPKDKS